MDPIFESFVDSHEDVIPISFNAWWPYSQDPFYQHNIGDNTGRVLLYEVPWVPHVRVDGATALSRPPTYAEMQTEYDLRKSMPTSVSLDLSGSYNEDTRELDCTVTATNDAPLPAGDYRLHVVLTESEIYFDGGNGVLWHQHVMRAMLPDFDGTMVDFSGAFPQMADAAASLTLDGIYEQDNCRLVYFLQDHDSFEVLQAGSIDLMDLADVVAVDTAPAHFNLGQNYPNPFNPETSIPVHVEREGVLRLEVVDASGRVVRTLHDGPMAAGSRTLSWNGRDDRGNSLASGLYLVNLSSGDRRSSRRVMLLK